MARSTAAPIAATGTMTFRSSPLGPLGFVDGMIARTTAPYDKYVRTDVCGAYKWNGTAWENITDALSMKDKIGGVLSLALDVKQTNVLYLAASSNTNNGGVYKSTDGGQTWSFTGPNVAVNANANYRNVGERLAVDPNNSSIIYFGTQSVS